MLRDSSLLSSLSGELRKVVDRFGGFVRLQFLCFPCFCLLKGDFQTRMESTRIWRRVPRLFVGRYIVEEWIKVVYGS